MKTKSNDKLRARPTQRERSERTRSKLIDATISILYRRGYAAVTTTAICREANVSRGAMLHQFPTKVDTLVSVARTIIEGQDRQRRKAIFALPRGRERFSALTDVVWQTMDEPASMALIEIMLGSRSDPELDARFGEVLTSLEEQLIAGPLAIAEDVGITDLKRVEAMCRLHLAAMRGLMINRLFQKDPSKIAECYRLLKWYKVILEKDLLD